MWRGGCVCPVVSNPQLQFTPEFKSCLYFPPTLRLNMHYDAFTLDVRSVLNENLCGILGGTRC
jgi:hypothetical protein